jgi:hypothetical protein
MAVQNANVKGIKFIESPRGDNKTGIAVVTFDVAAAVAGADTVQLGGAGTENGVATTATLATMFQNRRRDGRTVTLGQVMGGWAGKQTGSTNGPDIYVQTPAISAGNVNAIALKSAATGGSAITTLASAWDAPAALMVSYSATYPANNPE